MKPSLGLGIGWRPELALDIERHPGLGFVEIVAEDFDPREPLPLPLTLWRERGLPIIPHAISLSLGGAEPPAPDRIRHLDQLARQVDAPFVSEHLSFVRAGGLESGHLMPVQRTHAALEILIDNIQQARAELSVPLALENVACLIEWPHAEMDEAVFLRTILERTDTLLLLDIENVYANARNHGFDALAFLEQLPLERIAYVHIAGGIERKGLYHDTHAHPIPPAVLDLLEQLCARTTVPGVMLERDDNFPTSDELRRELDAIQAAHQRGTSLREKSHVVC